MTVLKNPSNDSEREELFSAITRLNSMDDATKKKDSNELFSAMKMFKRLDDASNGSNIDALFSAMNMDDASNDSNSDALFRAVNYFKNTDTGFASLSPFSKVIKVSEARQEAVARTANLLKNWSILREIIARHEATIQKRWANKTTRRRIDLLLEAWPGMPPSHRPDFAAFHKETQEQRDAGTNYRDWYMFPYVNQEDLSNPGALPLFLSARATCHPSEFAGSDGEAMRLGRSSGSIVPIIVNYLGMLLNGITGATEYGKLFHFDDYEDGEEWILNGIQYRPGEGLLILEAQDRTLAFLVDCCQRILHDISPSALLSTAYPVQAGIGTNGNGRRSSLPSPAQINFERTICLLEARKSAAEDHLLSIREDPGYFADQLLQFKEHRTEFLDDTLGEPHPIWQWKRGKETFWSRVIGNVVPAAYKGVQIWNELVTQAQKLQKLQIIYAGDISPTKRLPEPYLHALLKFQFYLKQASQGPLFVLKSQLRPSVPWRPFFARVPPEDPTSTVVAVVQREGKKLNSVQQQMFWLLDILWDNSDQAALFGVVNDELGHLIQTKAEARDMLTDYINNELTDLKILSECLRQISLYQPWANNFEDAMNDRKISIIREWDDGNNRWRGVYRAFDRPGLYARVGDPSDKKFEYPVDRRRTKQNNEAMRQAETKLDVFWKEIDRLMHDYAGGLRGEAVGRLLSRSRTLRRTPEWVEPARTASSIKSSTIKELIRPLSEFYFDLEQRSSQSNASDESIRPKTKTKTRGQPSIPAQVAEDPTSAAVPDHAESQPTFSVDGRALKVFRILFYTPSLTATPGEVPWKDFLHAMVSTGFRAEKLYGSVWQFTPTSLDIERGIQFHEPHPSPKIPYWIARRFGRRLTQTYGWETGMFVLKARQKKDGDEEEGKKKDAAEEDEEKS